MSAWEKLHERTRHTQPFSQVKKLAFHLVSQTWRFVALKYGSYAEKNNRGRLAIRPHTSWAARGQIFAIARRLRERSEVGQCTMTEESVLMPGALPTEPAMARP